MSVYSPLPDSSLLCSDVVPTVREVHDGLRYDLTVALRTIHFLFVSAIFLIATLDIDIIWQAILLFLYIPFYVSIRLYSKSSGASRTMSVILSPVLWLCIVYIVIIFVHELDYLTNFEICRKCFLIFSFLYLVLRSNFHPFLELFLHIPLGDDRLIFGSGLLGSLYLTYYYPPLESAQYVILFLGGVVLLTMVTVVVWNVNRGLEKREKFVIHNNFIFEFLFSLNSLILFSKTEIRLKKFFESSRRSCWGWSRSASNQEIVGGLARRGEGQGSLWVYIPVEGGSVGEEEYGNLYNRITGWGSDNQISTNTGILNGRMNDDYRIDQSKW